MAKTRVRTQHRTKRKLVSLKTLSHWWDVDRTTARRHLRHAGIQPVVLGSGRNGSVRYVLAEIEAWLQSRHRAT